MLEKSKIQDEADNTRVSREIQILRNARHPNIIQLYEVPPITELDNIDPFETIPNYRVRWRRITLRPDCVAPEVSVPSFRLDEFQASKYLQQIINAV